MAFSQPNDLDNSGIGYYTNSLDKTERTLKVTKINKAVGHPYMHSGKESGYGSKVNRKKQFTRHQKPVPTEGNNKLFHCCKQEFKSNVDYRRHVQMDHNDEFHYELNESKFKRKKMVKRRRSINTEENLSKNTDCSSKEKYNLKQDYNTLRYSNNLIDLLNKHENSEANSNEREKERDPAILESPSQVLQVFRERCRNEPFDLPLPLHDKDRTLNPGAYTYGMHANNFESNNSRIIPENPHHPYYRKCFTPEPSTMTLLPILTGSSSYSDNNNLNHSQFYEHHYPTMPQQFLENDQIFLKENNSHNSSMPTYIPENLTDFEFQQRNIFLPYPSLPEYLPDSFHLQPPAYPNHYQFNQSMDVMSPKFQEINPVANAAGFSDILPPYPLNSYREVFPCWICERVFHNYFEFCIHAETCTLPAQTFPSPYS